MLLLRLICLRLPRLVLVELARVLIDLTLCLTEISETCNLVFNLFMHVLLSIKQTLLERSVAFFSAERVCKYVLSWTAVLHSSVKKGLASMFQARLGEQWGTK